MTWPELQQIDTEAPFQALLETAPDAMVIVDASGQIVLVNHQAEQLFGYERADLIGQAVEVLLPERLRQGHTRYRGSFFVAPHARPMGSGLDLVARRQDGSEFPVEISLSPLHTESGLLITSAIRDISERKRAEAELRRQTASQLARLEEQQRTLAARLDTTEAGMLQAARLAAVGQLAASIAHEINNPLYAARNCLALLEQDAPATMRESPFLGIASEQLSRIAAIIERMREFYRPDRGTLAPCDIHHLLEETLALARLNIRHQSIRVVFTPAPTLPEVVGNGDQLRQVFLNLILNAIEAMADGGTLTVRTIAGPSVALIEVQDTGIGIPADIRPQLFEPFFTNKPNGTGLGLSISAHIVTQHGGQIEVESSEGQGSIFRVVLPYQPDR